MDWPRWEPLYWKQESLCSPWLLQMMGKRATEAAQVLIDELGLEGQLSPEQFLKEREELLDKMFPQAELLPGAGEEGSVSNECSCVHTQMQHEGVRG
jgi:hypothetical protein